MSPITVLFLIASVTISCISAQDEDAAPAPPSAPVPSPPAGGGGDSSKVYPVDETKLAGQRERICKLVPKLGGDAEKLPAWSDTMTSDEVFELALLNLAYGLGTDSIAHLPKNMGWKKQLVDLISFISLVTCDTEYIPTRFINGVKNLFLYYLIKREHSVGTNGTENAEKWQEILSDLSKCADQVSPIEFSGSCGEIEAYNDPEVDGNAEPVDIIYEQFDHEFRNYKKGNFDMIVDSIWWMFSISYARCYRLFYPEEDNMLTFQALFREDIISQFEQRWRGGGDLVDQFAIILGPVDADDSHENLRKCSVAAYNVEGLKGRQLVRPVLVTVDNAVIRNYKML